MLRWSGHHRFLYPTPHQIQTSVNRAHCRNSFCHYIPKTGDKKGSFAQGGNSCLAPTLKKKPRFHLSRKLQTTAAAGPQKRQALARQSVWKRLGTNVNVSWAAPERAKELLWFIPVQRCSVHINSSISLQHASHFWR